VKNPPIADYDPTDHEIRLILPPGELYERAKLIPGIHERPKQGIWASPATAGIGARVIELYGHALYGPSLEVTESFRVYMEERIDALNYAQKVLRADPNKLPEIPIASRQPVGEWVHARQAFWFAYYLEAAMLDITMGGGKTEVAINLALNWDSQRVLVISPLGPIDDRWLPDLQDHYLRPAYAFSRTNHKQMAGFVEELDHHWSLPDSSNGNLIALVNHEAFWREPFRSWAKDRRWDLIIDDEIHREKSAGSQQSGYLYQLGGRARRRLGLTGTLMPHSPLDAYGQYRFLDRGILGTNVGEFYEDHAIMGGFENRQVVGFRNVPALMDKINTITIHIDDSNQNLPRVAPDIERKFDLEPKVRTVYDKMDKEFMVEIKSGVISAKNPGVKLLRLHQIASGLIKLDDKDSTKRLSSIKIGLMRDILMDFNRDEPIVVFTRFVQDMYDLEKAIDSWGRRPAIVGDGENELKRWKAGKADVLLGQIQAVKEGIDLTRSAVGIFYSTGINLGDYLQCRKRLHRPPQNRMVRFIHLLARGTRDIQTWRSLRARHDVLSDIRAEGLALRRAGA
jgi:superfamily II DNA or RNA helicase